MSALDAILSLLFPPRCAFCGKSGVRGVCPECEKSLPYCKTPLHERPEIGACLAPLKYEGAVREAVHRLKFKGKLGGLDCFGQLMAETAAEHFSGAFDAITWVPVSRERLRKRGYDQARLLAASVCVDWHVAPQETLRKTVDNPAQSGLSDAAERRANVLGVYEAVHPEEIRGKRFLLIDDVLTTGSTLAECARVLREAGAADVLCLTLAMTRGKK